MKFALLLTLLLVLCAAVVLSQNAPAGEKPHDVASEEPTWEGNPEKPSEDSNSVVSTSDDKPEDSNSVVSNSDDKPEDSNSVVSNSADESSSEVSFCIALAMECPDGSYASQDSECNYICGAPPTGNLSYSYVDTVRLEFQAAYRPVSVEVGELQGKNIVVHPPEKKSDLCLEVSISSQDVKVYPAVYNSVRVFYTKVSDTPVCSPQICPDGSVVGCDDICPPEEDSDINSFFVPFVLVFGVVILSACCCCIRRRRCKAACNRQNSAVQQVAPSHTYPAEYYELLQQEEQAQLDQALAESLATQMPPQMPPQLMAQPMIFPPMPHIPPHMLQNGSFPVMIQAPNGMWYMAPPHPEEASLN